MICGVAQMVAGLVRASATLKLAGIPSVPVYRVSCSQLACTSPP